MALSLRYKEKPVGESVAFAMDFSTIIPPGQAIQSVTIAQFTNVNPPAATTDFTLGPPTHNGRRAFATVSGGVAGTDYQLAWTATDTLGNVFARTALVLVANTS